MAEAVVQIGPFTAGEKPPPLIYTFLDSFGVAINLEGAYSAKFSWREKWGTGTVADASIVDATGGEVMYTWTGAEMATPGRYLSELWVSNGSTRLASVLIKYDVRRAVAPPGI